VDGGIAYKGLLPTRDYDSIGLAASYLKMSDDIRDAQRDVNRFLPGSYPHLVDYEAVVELTYKAQLAAWWTVQTSIQRPMHPGGSGAIKDAWAFIALSTLRF
jgi:porin